MGSRATEFHGRIATGKASDLLSRRSGNLGLRVRLPLLPLGLMHQPRGPEAIQQTKRELR